MNTYSWNECPPDSLACHPMTGHYNLDETHNEVTLTIDRTSSGGVVETYHGGWARDDFESLSFTSSVELVLRSDLTGLQLVISHNVYPLDGCLR